MTHEDDDSVTSVRLKRDTRLDLAELGKKSQTFDEIIRGLIDKVSGKLIPDDEDDDELDDENLDEDQDE